MNSVIINKVQTIATKSKSFITLGLSVLTFISGLYPPSIVNAIDPETLHQYEIATEIVTGTSIDIEIANEIVDEVLTKEENDVAKTKATAELVEEEMKTQQQIIADEERRIQLEKEEAERKERERVAQIESITADPNDVSKVSNLTMEQLHILTEDTWWKGNEQALYDLEHIYGINAFYAMSVSTLESGHGTSERARYKDNYYGIEVSTDFGDLYNCTMYFGDFQKRLYIEKGLVSVWNIGPKYCPPNRNWETYMANKMNELYTKVMITIK